MEVRARAKTGRVETIKHICDVTFGGSKGKSQNTKSIETDKRIYPVTFGGGKGKSQNTKGRDWYTYICRYIWWRSGQEPEHEGQ